MELATYPRGRSESLHRHRHESAAPPISADSRTANPVSSPTGAATRVHPQQRASPPPPFGPRGNLWTSRARWRAALDVRAAPNPRNRCMETAGPASTMLYDPRFALRWGAESCNTRAAETCVPASRRANSSRVDRSCRLFRSGSNRSRRGVRLLPAAVGPRTQPCDVHTRFGGGSAGERDSRHVSCAHRRSYSGDFPGRSGVARGVKRV